MTTNSGRTERRSVRHISEAQERIEAASVEMEMHGTNEDAVFEVGSASLALEQEELKLQHEELDQKRQEAAEALLSAQQVDPIVEPPIGGIATLKDVLSEYGTVQEFSESFSATSTGDLASWFEDSQLAFSNLALIGASNAQLDGIFGGSDFLSGKAVPQLLETWNKCLAWTADSAVCNARIASLSKVACSCAGHTSQHVTQHHANLALPPFDRKVRFSRFLRTPLLTDTHRILLLLLGLGPVRISTILAPNVWQV